MKNTKIEWADHTINFWWGCTKVSAGCANCYAEGLDKRWHGGKHWGKGAPRRPRLEAARKEALALNRNAEREGRQYRIFANSMNDWLDPEVPIEWLAKMLDTIRITQNLTWMLLTKRPELWRDRIVLVRGYLLDETVNGDLSNWICHWDNGLYPRNVLIGTSVENQQAADERTPHLLNIPAKVRFLSCEPLLGAVDLTHWTHVREIGKGQLYTRNNIGMENPFSWLICGGESGPNARPMHTDWARSLRDQCQAAGVPFFFKQWGEWAPQDQAVAGLTSKTAKNALYLNWAGKTECAKYGSRRGRVTIQRVGKKAAGRLLDGREWNQLPEGEK